MSRQPHQFFRSPRRSIAIACIVGVLASVLALVATQPQQASAGIFFNDVEYTYKEYWANHNSFSGGCDHGTAPSYYTEPGPCAKTVTINIPDNVQSAIAAVIYVDLWRNRDSFSARFTINNGPQYRPNVGRDWSRTPYQTTIPLHELVQGTNNITFQEFSGAYHIHDVMVRVYHDSTNPLIPGPGSDVDPPTGSLTSIVAGGQQFMPGAGGVLNVDDDQVTLSATASGAKYVEFHGFYDGYDEDNDGVTTDWHSFVRNNWNTGGTEVKAAGGTIGHIGTDLTGPYEVTWNIPTIKDQTGVKFKIRVVDAAGNVREAAGGVSAPFELRRTHPVEVFTIPNFEDGVLYHGGEFPQLVTRTIDLPTDLANVDRAYILGNYWLNPLLSINNALPFPVFQGNEDEWRTSIREIDPTLLRPGSNLLKWSYVPGTFGQFVEAPGPMIVIHRAPPAGAPLMTTQPTNALATEGNRAVFTATATGELPLQYQWMRNGLDIPGATSSTYTTPGLLAADNGNRYSVRVTNGQGTVTSDEASVTISPNGAALGPWWDTQWDFRAPLTVAAGGIERTDKVVETILNFSQLMINAGSGGPVFDPNSVRVVEVDSDGNVVDADVPFQLDPLDTYDANDNAVANLVWMMEGVTAPWATRTYHVYFDKVAKAIPPPAPIVPRVGFTDNVVDDGYASYQFDTDIGTWIYHKTGGGFAALIDNQGDDWIGYSKTPEAAGDFRGIPNAVKTGGYFHPGRGTSKSKVLNSGPLKVTIESTSNNKSWTELWEIYPTYATFTMTKAGGPYWFLYEGTPGGDLDPADFVVRSDGRQTDWDDQWQEDLVNEEFVYVADPADDRSLYVAHHQEEGSVDSYWELDDLMTVLGFGRGGLNFTESYLSRAGVDGEPHQFTVGLTDSTVLGEVSPVVRNAYTDPVVTTGQPGFNGVFTGPLNDDFSAPTLNPMWTLIDVGNDATVSVGSNSALTMDVPSGLINDLWTGRINAPMLVQTVGDEDMEIEVKFNSSIPLVRQMQGVVFRQDDGNFLRVGYERFGTGIKLVAVSVVNGVATTRLTKNLGTTVPSYLRVARVGDVWTIRRAWGGVVWFNSPAFTFPINLTQVGVFAGSNGTPPPGHVAVVDYFRNRGLPVFSNDAPQLTNVTAVTSSRQAIVTWTTNVASTSGIDYGLSASLGSTAGSDTPTTSHSIVVNGLDCDSNYFYRITSSNTVATTQSDQLVFTTLPCGPVFSDDFNEPTLDPRWEFVDPVGNSTFNLTGTGAAVSVPAGSNHNLYAQANFAPRIRQAGPIGDFQIEAKFESPMQAMYQLQGLLVEEDDNSFARFDIYHNGTDWHAYAVTVADDVPTFRADVVIPAANPVYLRVTRNGNIWTYEQSLDGVGWSQVTQFELGMKSTFVGAYFGNTQNGQVPPPPFTGTLDYFFNTSYPIVPEDGGQGPDGTPPSFTNVVITPGTPDTQVATISWNTDEPATSRLDWGLTTSYTGTRNEATLRSAHTVTLNRLACGSTYHFRLQGTDASANVGTRPDATFSTPPCPAAAFSDDFFDGTIDPRWNLVDPIGDGSVTESEGLLQMTVPAGRRHDLTNGGVNNGATRLVQSVSNTDFQIEAKFESATSVRQQIQGLVIEQDDRNLIRFDMSYTGSSVIAFVGRVTPGNLTTLASTTITGQVPAWLRVTRTGNLFTFQYSSDGASFVTIYSGNVTYNVTRVGPFVGASHPQVTSTPSHTATIDYFFNTASPIVPEDGGTADSRPNIELFYGDNVEFGTPSMVQPDVNIPGRVTDLEGIASLTYSVNGGASVAMGMGDNLTRLARPGDFNVNVHRDLLVPGANTVMIRAVDIFSNVREVPVTVNFSPGHSATLPFSTDWATTAKIEDVGQVVDGRWAIQGDTVRATELGYDRLLGFGDDTWTSYEATVPVTMLGYDPIGFRFPSSGPAVGLLAHWAGHFAADATQPPWGFADGYGAIGWYRWAPDINGERLQIMDPLARPATEDLSGRTLQLGVTYIMKLRAEANQDGGPRYSYKVWEQGQPEPSAWDLIVVMPPGTRQSGGLLLLAHHVDATFGDVSITPLVADAPAISPNGGTFVGRTEVSISTSTIGAQIRYTTDGSPATASSPLYTQPFFVDESSTVKAIAVKPGQVDSSEASADFTITPAPYRVTSDLQLLYDFGEGSGTTVHDISGVGTPVDLTIESGSTSWIPGALRVDTASVIRSADPAVKFTAAAKAANALTVEAWVDPVSLGQTGPAVIAGVGATTPTARDVSLGQSNASYDLALRTSRTDSSGQPSLGTGAYARDRLHHVVMTRDANLVWTMYINGVAVQSLNKMGNFNNWFNGYPVWIAGMAGAQPWLGDLYLTAFYSKALSAAEVLQNYEAGPDPTPPNSAPVVSAGSDLSVLAGDTVNLDGVVTDDGLPDPPAAVTTQWTVDSGPGTVTFGSATSAATTVSVDIAGVYVLRLTADDGEATTFDTMQIEAVPPGSTVATPVITPNGGTFAGSATVTITAATSGATVHYTTDGSPATTASPVYTAPITVLVSSTVRAIAVRAGLVDSAEASASFTITPGDRVATGLQALYTFAEGSGNRVNDSSGVGTALNISIPTPSAVNWVPGGLRIVNPTQLTSIGSAAKIANAVKASNAITIEAWIKPTNTTQTGPAKIVNISANHNATSTALSQSAGEYNVRFRTTTTNTAAEPSVTTAGGAVTTGLQHVVYTRDAAGNARVYIDGVLHDSFTSTGSTSSWATTHSLTLASETDGSRRWLGEYYLVAFYDRALSDTEVFQNYVIGDV